MGLSLLGRESLEELEAMVRKYFTDIKNKNVKVPSWPHHPYGDQQPRKVYVVPVKDLKSLELLFPIPDMQPHYKTKPGSYLSHLIGHEGKGSLLSELKARGWANDLEAWPETAAKGFGFFKVNMFLTQDGQEHVDEIVTLLFQYLQMLREVGPLKWVFDENTKIRNTHFHYKDKGEPLSYTCQLAHDLHYYPLEEVLSGPSLLGRWEPELINSVLDKLVPDKMTVMVISQKFKEEAQETEEWYGTKFKVEQIPAETIKMLSNVSLDEKFQLPDKNIFIPTNFELVDEMQRNPNHPLIIGKTPLMRTWFKQDNEFHLPKASIRISFLSPAVSADPHIANMTELFIDLLNDDLAETTYSAYLAGLYYSLYSVTGGFDLTIDGFDESQGTLLDTILQRIFDFKVNQERFKALKERHHRWLKNFNSEQPNFLARCHENALLYEPCTLYSEELQEIDRLTFDALQKFQQTMLSKIRAEALIHGNLTEESALLLASKVEQCLVDHGVKPPTKTQRISQRCAMLSNNSHYLYTTQTEVHKSSCISVYYQCGLKSTASNALIELFLQIISEPCFDMLRTKEQLGYIVWSQVREVEGVQGLRIIVQSDRHPVYLDTRIEAFLHSVEEHIEKMDEEEFERHKTSLAEKRLEKPKVLGTRTWKFWSEIVCEQYNFDRDQVEVAEMRKLAKQDVLAFYHKFLSHKSKERRKLATHVVSMKEDGAGKCGSDPNNNNEKSSLEDLPPPPQADVFPEIIEDPTEFKAHQPLFPTLKPYADPDTFLKASLKAMTVPEKSD